MSCNSVARFALFVAILTGAFCASNAQAQITLLSEDFEGVKLKDSSSPTEVAAPAVWTEVPPTGWNRDNSTTPIGSPVEFQGWTFMKKDWWSQTAGDQQRSTFAAGQGVVAVADADEYDDGTDIDTAKFNVFLETPSIDLAGVAASTVNIKFDSSFRAEPTQIGKLYVSFDDGANYSEIFQYDSNVLEDGLTINEMVNVTANNPSSGKMKVRWGLVEGSNDWWWAIDNVSITARQIPEPSSLSLLGLVGLGLLKSRRRS